MRRFSVATGVVLVALAAAAPSASAWPPPAQITAGDAWIQFDGGLGDNHLTVSRVGDEFEFTDTLVPIDPGPCAAVDSNTVDCPTKGVLNVYLEGGVGDDYLEDDLPRPEVYAHPRVQIFGQGGDDVTVGGPSDEYLYFGPGSDTVNGGAGRDHLSTIALEPDRGPFSVSLDGVANDGYPGEHGNVMADVDWVEGDDVPETMIGSAGSERFDTYGGDDVIIGGGGADFLTSSGGSDQFYGGPGDDSIYADDPAGGPQDKVDCGAGSDSVAGGGPKDVYMSTCERTPLNPYGDPNPFPPPTVKLEPSADLSGSSLKVRVRCSVTAWPCAGTIGLRKVAASKHPGIGTARFKIGSARTKTVTVPLSAGALRHVAHAKRVVVLASARDAKQRRARNAREQVVE